MAPLLPSGSPETARFPRQPRGSASGPLRRSLDPRALVENESQSPRYDPRRLPSREPFRLASRWRRRRGLAIVLLWLGALILAVGLGTLGVGLLAT